MFSIKICLATLIFFPFLIFSCKQNRIQDKKEGFYLEAKFDSIKMIDGIENVIVTTRLVNKTPNTIQYINYNCSWLDAYLTDNKTLDVGGNMCNHNYPTRYHILSDSAEKERTIAISPYPKRNINVKKFRVGFIYIPFTSSETFDDDAQKLHIDSIVNKDTKDEMHYWRKNDKENIIWSDTLTIP